MKASVLVCARNEEDTVGACIKSLISQDFPKEDYEIVVVDDCSMDGTASILKGFSGEVKYVRNRKPRGRAYSRNRALNESEGDVVCFIDADAYADRKWLSNLTGPYEGKAIGGKTFPKEMLGGVGGFVGIWNRDSLVARYSEEGGIRFVRIQQGSKVALSQVGFGTCNIAYPRPLIERVGGFDEGLVLGSDLDVNLKIIDAGFIFAYNPDARVYHKHPDSAIKLVRKWFEKGRYHRRIMEKHPDLDFGLIAKMVNVKELALNAVSYWKTPLFLPIEVSVRISFLAGWLLGKFER